MVVKKRKHTYRVIEEPFPKSFPAHANRKADNEAVHAYRLSELDFWKQLADRRGKAWFITTAGRRHERSGEKVRVFILYCQGQIGCREDDEN